MPFGSVSVPPWTPAVHLAPAALDGWDAELFRRRLLAGYDAPAIAFTAAEGLLVTGSLFATISATRGLLPESVYIMPRLRWTEIFDGIGSVAAYANGADAPAMVAGNAGHANYYHWLLQSVAAMLVERTRGSSTPFIVPALTGWRQDTLTLFGIDNPLVQVPQDGGLAANFAFTCNLTSGDHAFAPHPDVLALFRAHASRTIGVRDRHRRLYLSRAGATANRPLVNEAAVIALLAENGFEIVAAGDLSLLEQITLLREAELVVAPHGAALANLVWTDDAADGPMVVELMQANYLNRCFAKLGQAKRLRYSVIVNRHHPSDDHHHRSTWEADLPSLRAVLGL